MSTNFIFYYFYFYKYVYDTKYCERNTNVHIKDHKLNSNETLSVITM